MQLTFNVDKQSLTRSDVESPASESVEYLTAKFTFSDDWDGTTKTAVFTRSPTVINQILDENGVCKVPAEIIKANGAAISVFGTDGTKRITTNPLFVRINLSGYAVGSTPEPPTPTVYEQLIGKIDEVKQDIPDVPEWSMQPDKPSYTVEEVGALPDNADSNLVHKTGDETIAGNKMFTGNVTAPNLVGGDTVYAGSISNDLNAITKNGFYTCYGAAVGAPNSSSSWFIKHQNSNVGILSASQIGIAYGDNQTSYERKKVDGTWKAWTRIPNKFDITGEVKTQQLTNSLLYPFNNSTATITLQYPRSNVDYTIQYEVFSITGGFVGDINISEKTINGFKIAYTGSATSITVKLYIKGGLY